MTGTEQFPAPTGRAQSRAPTTTTEETSVHPPSTPPFAPDVPRCTRPHPPRSTRTARRRRLRALVRRVRHGLALPDDRGDVPGWVLVTIMTAGLVAALWAIAAPQLTDLFRTAIRSAAGGP